MTSLKNPFSAAGTYPLAQGQVLQNQMGAEASCGLSCPFLLHLVCSAGVALVGAQVPLLHPPCHLVWVLEATIGRAPQMGLSSRLFMPWMLALRQRPAGSSTGVAQISAAGAHAWDSSAGEGGL